MVRARQPAPSSGVVQREPMTMATRMASTPHSMRCVAWHCVPTLPPMTWRSELQALQTTALGVPHPVGRELRVQHVCLLEARVHCHPDVPHCDIRLPSTPRIGAFAVSINQVRSSAKRSDSRRCWCNSVMSWPLHITPLTAMRAHELSPRDRRGRPR